MWTVELELCSHPMDNVNLLRLRNSLAHLFNVTDLILCLKICCQVHRIKIYFKYILNFPKGTKE